MIRLTVEPSLLDQKMLNSRPRLCQYIIKATHLNHTMHYDIEHLKSTTFGGRRFTRKQLAHIRETLQKCSVKEKKAIKPWVTLFPMMVIKI